MNPIASSADIGMVSASALNGKGPATSLSSTESHSTQSVDWKQVYAALHPIWEEMILKVTRQWPEYIAHIREPEIRGCVFVTSYCDFEVPTDHAIDPVLAEVAFRPTTVGDCIFLSCDILGESSGKVFFEGPQRVVSNSLPEIIAEAVDLAKTLCERHEIIHEALRQPECPSEILSGDER